MADPRALAALDRIERALARIEAAAGSAAPASAENAGELARLRAAHEALRGRVRGAIAQVDRLIDSAEAR